MPNANADAILVDVGVAYRAPECSWYIKVSQFKKLPKQEKSQGDKSSLELPVQVPVATNPTPVRAYRLGSALSASFLPSLRLVALGVSSCCVAVTTADAFHT
jgi:hypothetical protein